VGAIAQLAYERRINVTMEFESVDNSESGSMQFFRKTMALEDELWVLNYYRPTAVPQEVLDMAAKEIQMREEETRKALGVEEAQ
jgi:hypothetical protein